MKALLLCLSLLGAASLLPAASPDMLDRHELPTRQLHLILKPVLQLPDSNIVAASETLRVGDRLLQPGVDYQLDHLTGRLTLLNGSLPGRETAVSYALFPAWLPRRLGGRTPAELPLVHPDSVELVTPQLFARPREEPATALNYQGSFLRGIRIGNQSGVDLESGLRLKVDGRIGSDIEVAAFLTDQVSPLQPEGNTQNLEEIDRIYVEVGSPDFTVTMGNFYLDYGGMQLLNYSRRIEGVQGGWHRAPLQVGGAVALSRGRFNSVTLNGLDGVQGPYRLPDETGEAGILVIAGTEQIWLDGLPLTRGQQQDYIIDYSTGEITFSNRYVITAESRITVDYEFSAQHYRRQIYALDGGGTYYEGQNVKVRYLEERDDYRNPLGWTETDEIAALLREAGDDLQRLQISGAHEVEPGRGGYRLIDAEAGQWGEYAPRPDPFTADSVYRFDVLFTRLGRDAQGVLLGDYERNYNDWGYTVYHFVGENLGEWAPVRLITPPAAQRMIGLQLENNWREHLRFNNEVVMSDYDRNLRSGLDDGDNLGLASLHRLRLQAPLRLPLLGVPSLETLLRLRDTRYLSLNRDQEAEYHRNWALPQQAITVWQQLESTLQLRRSRFSYTRFNVGRVLTADDREALRWGGEGVYQDSLGRGLQLRYRTSRAGANRLHQAAGSSRQDWGLVRLTGELAYELTRSALREVTFTSPRLAVASPLAGQLLQLAWQQRRQWGSDSSGVPLSFTSREYNLQLEPQQKRNLLISGGVTHYEKDWDSPDSAAVRTDLGQVHLVFANGPGNLRLDGDYRIDRSLVSELVTVYVPVDSGLTGNYSEDPPGSGHFVPDPYGDYTAYTHATGDFLPTRGVQLSLRMSDTFWNRLRLSSRLRVEGRSRTRHPLRFYCLLPAELDDDSTRLAILTATQQLRFPFADGEQNLQLSWDESRRLDRLVVNAASKRRETRIGLEHDWRLLASVTLREQVGLKLLRETGFTINDLRTWRAGGGVEWRFGQGLTLRLDYLGRYGFKAGGGQAIAQTAAPGLTWRFRKRGRLSTGGSYTYAWADREQIPLELLEGNRIGSNLTLDMTLDYRIGTATHITSRVDYRRLPGRPTNYSFSMQWQSFF